MFKSIHCDSSIEWKLIILVQLFHFSTQYFHFDAGNSQPQIRIENQPMRSKEQQLNQRFELVLPISC